MVIPNTKYREEQQEKWAIKNHVRIGCPPRTWFKFGCYLPARADFSVAIAAINRFVTARLERNFCSFAAFGTGSREHLSFGPEGIVSVAFGFSGLAALGTALGLVGIAF
jgi:hypothetical protein